MEVPILNSLEDLADLVSASPGLRIRYSEGWDADGERGSFDTASDLELPGLSFNPLSPEQWWSRPLTDLLAGQLRQNKHPVEKNPGRRAWSARGACVGRGPECEPLLGQVQPVVQLCDALRAEAELRYWERFDAGKGPGDQGANSS